jgi:hypothetical protein
MGNDHCDRPRTHYLARKAIDAVFAPVAVREVDLLPAAGGGSTDTVAA